MRLWERVNLRVSISVLTVSDWKTMIIMRMPRMYDLITIIKILF